MIRIIHLFLLCAILVGGCSKSESVTGKPGGDQTDNGVYAIAVDSTGSPIASARVIIHPSNWIPSNELDSTLAEGNAAYTNGRGEFSISELQAGNYIVEIRHAGTAIQRQIKMLKDPINLGTLELTPTGMILGHTVPNSWIGVVGLSHWTYSNSDGLYVLDSVPRGAIEVTSKNIGNTWVLAQSKDTVIADTLAMNTEPQFLLENFEHQNTKHLWASIAGNSWWYFAYAENTTINPANIRDNPIYGIDTAEIGHALHVQYQFDSTVQKPWAEVGVSVFAQNDIPVNLTRLTAVAFRAKGNGLFKLYLTSLDSGRISYDITLTPDWKDFRVPVDSLQMNGTISKDSLLKVLPAVTGLSWQCVSDAELWLDNVRLIGVTPRDIWE